MVVFLQRLGDGGEVQTLEAIHFNSVVLQAPLLCLKREDAVNVFKQSRDGVGLRTVRVWDAPQDIRGGQVVPLHREAQPHLDAFRRA